MIRLLVLPVQLRVLLHAVLNLPNSVHKGIYMWVTDGSGTYIMTIQNYVGPGSFLSGDNPVRWQQTPGYNNWDGISQATVAQNTAYQTVSWGCTNSAGNAVPAGSYKICLEICIDHAASSEFHTADIVIGSASATGAFSTGTQLSSGTVYFTANP